MGGGRKKGGGCSGGGACVQDTMYTYVKAFLWGTVTCTMNMYNKK